MERRSQLDRISSRQLLDQEQFEQKLGGLLKRQSILESRAAALSVETLTTGSIRPALPDAPVRRKISAITDTIVFSAPPTAKRGWNRARSAKRRFSLPINASRAT